MNTRGAWLVAAAFVAAGASGACGASARSAGDPRGVVAPEGEGDGPRVAGGRFSRKDVERALAADRDALAGLDKAIAQLDASDEADPGDARLLRVAALRADRAARSATVAELTGCLEREEACPPSLDEPAIPSDFDAATGELSAGFEADATRWPQAAAAIEQHACACRTAACVAWVDADLQRWEAALSPSAEGDEVTAGQVTRARGCLWRRLGR